MPDAFANRTRTPAAPAVAVYSITPDDENDLPQATIALNVATPGTVRVTTVQGTTEDIAIQPGYAFPLRVTRVWLTGTTATGIRGLA